MYGSVLLWLKAPLALTSDESGPFQENIDGECHLVWKGHTPLYAPNNLHIPCETGKDLMDQARIKDGVMMRNNEDDMPYAQLRRAERDVVVAHPDLKFYFDKRYMSMIDALCSMSQTIFICFVLCVGALMFSKDANDLVLNPIERMVNKMEKIRDNPLAATRLGDANEQAKENEANTDKKDKQKKKKKKAEPMETKILETTIIKLGGLLALGFGEAGAEIIGQNIKGSDMSFQGKKMLGIFGFCDIRNFTDATEVLQDQVMVFVNQIAEIVHSIVDQYSGAANKNIGDAFLLVWRLSDLEKTNFWKLQFEDGKKSTLTRRQSRLSQLKNGKQSDEPASPKALPKVSKQKEQQIMNNVISKMTDMALMSFIKIIVSINKSAVLAEYRTHEGLCRRMPGYKVKMGFGLHIGWAIEGPIGSEFKIDASYLSPNVNMASRLEAATKQYGTPMLLSGFFVERLTAECRKYCRRIDCVRVKGSKQPVEMWVVDMDTDRLKVQPEEEKQVVRSKFKKRQLREAAKTRMWIPSYTIHSSFENDADLLAVREPFTEEFLTTFTDGYLKFEKGDWQGAREIFAQTQTILGLASDDGPSITLLGVMKEHFFISPSGWQGCRDLTEK
jgi:class 3 adenylate cyclase